MECVRDEQGLKCQLFQNTFVRRRGSLIFIDSISEKGKKCRGRGHWLPRGV